MRAMFKLLILVTVSACATKAPVSRVKSSFYIKFKDGDVSKNELMDDGTRKIHVGKTPEQKAELKKEWSDLTDHVAIPTTDYNKLLNRQNL